MRRIAFTCLCLAVTGCGYATWSNPPFTTGTNPHFPAGDSENLRRVMGARVETPPLTPEPGDIWPGPLPPEPTLQELEKQGETSAPERPVPGSPDFQPSPPNLPPAPARGSSTPPGSNQPGATRFPAPRPPPPVNTAPPAPNTAGQVTATPQGPGVTSGGTSGYQTIQTPGGGSAIVVPNGNGTSTIIHSDGKIETVPTPR